MDFKDFMIKLSPVLKGTKNNASFTKEVLENVITEEQDLKGEAQLILDEYKDSTYKALYNNPTKIKGVAKKISQYLEPMAFEKYINKSLSSGSLQNLCSSFKQDIPDIDLCNAGEKLSVLLNKILLEAASESVPAKINISQSKEKEQPVTNFGETLKIYLGKALKKYSREKTLLAPDSYCNLMDFYVSNDIKFKSTLINNPTIEKLSTISNHLIIQGTAGLGKSTLLKYLFLSASSSVLEFGVVPVLIEKLNRYRGEPILDYVLKNIQEFDGDISLEVIESALSNGSLLLLIDGIDEIKHQYITEFNLQLESYLNKYYDTPIIITSRPVDDFMQFSSFIVGEICPFSVEQSVMFVEKQNWDTVKKKDFIDDVYHYYSHELDPFSYMDATWLVNLHDKYRQFISNPLLLMILLITYTPGEFFPKNTITIYQKIYEILAKRHDSTKGLIKEYRTQLSFDDFYDYFAEFCALSYEDQVGEFTYLQLKSYTKQIKFKGRNISTEDFVSDLKNNVSLLREDGDRYYFIHRSFQEYFAAVHYSSLPDKDFTKLISVFNRGLSNDETLSMLIEIAPKKVKQLIFLPFLDQVMSKDTTCESFKEYIKLSSNYIKFDETNRFSILGSDLTNELEKLMFREFDCDDLPGLFQPVSNDIYNTEYDSLYAKAEAIYNASEDPISESELDLIEGELYSGEYQELEYESVFKDIHPSPIVIPIDYIFEHLNQYTNTFKYLCTPSKSYSMRVFIYLERYYGRLKKEFLF